MSECKYWCAVIIGCFDFVMFAVDSTSTSCVLEVCELAQELFLSDLLMFSGALHPRRPWWLLGTGSPGWPPQLSRSPWALSSASFVQCCFMSTETVRTVTDGEPRMAPWLSHSSRVLWWFVYFCFILKYDPSWLIGPNINNHKNLYALFYYFEREKKSASFIKCKAYSCLNFL